MHARPPCTLLPADSGGRGSESGRSCCHCAHWWATSTTGGRSRQTQQLGATISCAPSKTLWRLLTYAVTSRLKSLTHKEATFGDPNAGKSCGASSIKTKRDSDRAMKQFSFPVATLIHNHTITTLSQDTMCEAVGLPTAAALVRYGDRDQQRTRG